MTHVALSTVQLAALLAVALVAGGVGAMVVADAPADPPERPTTDDGGVSTFDSAEEFRSYLRAGDRHDRHAFGGGARMAGGDGARRTASDDVAVEEADGGAPDAAPSDQPAATPVADDAADGSGSASGGGAPDRRASGTNVQVEGVDEPDVLKTTPDTLYYATEGRRARPRPHPPGGPDGADEGVRLIDADDPAAPAVASRLNVSGDLLLAGETLVVFEADRLVGYDVSDRASPERTWARDLDDRVVAARLHAGTVYLVTADGVDRREPCPVEPMEGVSVPCTAVHHPEAPVPVDTTYTVSLLDPADGDVADSTSFVGASGRSVVHVSADRVYVTYPEPVDRADLMAEFLVTDGAEHLDEATLERVETVRSYDLSPRAKRVEIEHALDRWRAGLDREERREAERALREDMQSWAEANKREFERTGVVAFDVEGAGTDAPRVEAGATGSVPGHPLNQFSLDDHEGQFRIATTVSGAMGADSENDLYVLDEDLEVTGAVQGMGVTERIYSVRYVGDTAYVVTFRRIDPFHVVDLSDPTEPTVEGELKLPGFSTYLHPLSDDRVLGIGEEDRQVKLVVFDVSDPSEPTVETDRVLDERFSAVAESHHAFLIDRRHGVFFLPTDGDRGVRPVVEEEGDGDGEVRRGGRGYVFDYEDGLEEVTTVETRGSTRRAAYVGDHLYVFGESSLTVVDETTWEETATLNLTDDG